LASFPMKRRNYTFEGARDLHQGLGRFHLGNRLVHRNFITGSNHPAHQFGFGQPFSKVWQKESLDTHLRLPLKLVNRVENTFGAWQVELLPGRCGIRTTESGHAQHWGCQRVEATLLDTSDDFTGNRGEALGFSNDDGPAGLAYRSA